jgi:toxin ParE1/3/4
VALRINFLPQAAADIDAIWNHGAAKWSEAHADRYAEGLRQLVSLISDNPGIGRLQRDTSPLVRVHPYRAHVLIYTEIGDALVIVRVVPSRSDWTALLDKMS